MAYTHSPQIILDGLVLAMDAASQTSFRGIPTTNLIAGAELSIYNNVPGDVSISLTPTSETYKGATVWKQTLTPINSTGVSYLSNGNNPGIGTVIWGAGGGLANRYTGHSIFFKPTVPMHSVPIYLHYSNIPGWQQCCTPPEDMGDGWFRAYVIWYDTVTRSDGKFWAINPLTATLNTPIDIYWAGPFKEDRNDNLVVAPFVNGTRGTTAATGGGWVDRSGNGNNGELVNGVGFNSSNLGGLVFDGVDDNITLSTNIQSGYISASYEFFLETGALPVSDYRQIYIQESSTWIALYNFGGITFFGIDLNNGSGWFDENGGHTTGARTTTTLQPNTKYHLMYTWDGTTVRVYLNGNLESTTSTLQASNGRQNVTQLGAGTTPRMIGARGSSNYWNNKIYKVSFYNRALSQQEILQNYNAIKGRYGL